MLCLDLAKLNETGANLSEGCIGQFTLQVLHAFHEPPATGSNLGSQFCLAGTFRISNEPLKFAVVRHQSVTISDAQQLRTVCLT
jgi:hypothetical protein